MRVASDDGDEPHAVTADECDGPRDKGRCACKDRMDPSRRSFRSTWLDLPN